MTRVLRLVLLVATVALCPGFPASAQQPPAAPPAPAPEAAPPAPAAPAPEAVPSPAEPAPPAAADDRRPCDGWDHHPVFRLGQEFVVRRGEVVDDAVAVFGSAVIEGDVCGDMSVTLGDARLTQSSTVDGNVVVVGGKLTVEPGATVNGELVLVGGVMDAPADFRARRGHVVVGVPVLGDHLRGTVPYLTRGLLLGRLIVPDLTWTWVVTAVVLFVYLLINLLFPQAAWAAASTIADRPLSTFAAGVLVLLLSGPIAALLAVTVVGIALLPVLVGVLAVAWVVGTIAVCRWIGTRLFAQDDPDSRLESTRSLLVGFVVITVAYMIPVLGIVTWGLTGVLGLGAATLAFMRAFRRENPPAPPLPGREVPAVPPPPAPAVYAPPMPVAHVSPAGTGDASRVEPGLNRLTAADTYAPPPAFTGGPPAPEQPASAAGYAGTDDRALLAFPHAGFGERAAAFALDFVLVMLVTAVFDVDDPGNVVIFLLVAYHVAFWLWKRTTLGGIICQLRVTRVDGTPLRFVDALVRGVTAIFSLAALGIGALWILRDPERQSWHDKVAGTFVVRVPRNYPLP